MKILIVAATHHEVTGLTEYFNLAKDDFTQHAKFDLLITGVGMTATAFALGKTLTNDYALVVNVGIAGSFYKNIPLGSVVNVVKDTFAELGAEDHEKFISIDELGFGKSTYDVNYQLTDLPKVHGITVNKVHGNLKSIESILNRLNVQVESMEGASVFYACEQMNIKCLQVRAISNFVEPRTTDNWQIKLAIERLNAWLIDFINSDQMN